MTHEEFAKRRLQLIDIEMKNQPGWFYMSFASEERGFLGAAIVQGQGPVTANDRSWRLRINPGNCQVAFVELDAKMMERVPVEEREKLLSKADLVRIFGGIERMGIEEW